MYSEKVQKNLQREYGIDDQTAWRLGFPERWGLKLTDTAKRRNGLIKPDPRSSNKRYRNTFRWDELTEMFFEEAADKLGKNKQEVFKIAIMVLKDYYRRTQPGLFSSLSVAVDMGDYWWKEALKDGED